MRGRYEGTWNVVRFNWPKYVFGLAVLAASLIGALATRGMLAAALSWLAVLAAIALILPLLASYIIYDRSNLYTLPWLHHLPNSWSGSILNLNAGFDEISASVKKRLPNCKLEVADFYDPARHTEASIERARRAYTAYPDTRHVDAGLASYPDGSFDLVLAFLSLHEVRDPQERIQVLSAIDRILRQGGHLIVTEHLRDLPNFLAFNFGFLHFHSRTTWLQAFARSGFDAESIHRTTAFITTYTLRPR